VKERSWLSAYIALGTVWGCSFIFIKLGLEFLTPVGVAFGRTALGAIALVVVSKSQRISLPRKRKIWSHLWVMAILLNVIPGVLFAFAETRVTSVLAGILNAVTPLMTLLAIIVVFHEQRPAGYQVVGLFIGFTGVLTVLGVWQGLGSNSPLAVLALVAAVTCYGIAFPYSRKFILPYKLQPEALATGQVSLAALTLLPFYLFNRLGADHYRIGSVMAMLALGILGTGYAYIWNFQIMAAAGSAIASSVTYVTPVVAVVVGVLFLGERVSWNEPIGGAIVLLGAAIAQGRVKLNRV
jgi:drug/metabolite transporter (DMT)-like permease